MFRDFLMTLAGVFLKMNKENIQVVESYLDALRQKDLSLAPFADDVIFEDPVAGKNTGAENFKAFLSGFLPAINDVKVIQHVCENDTVATRWEAETVFGTIPIGEFFRIKDGKITEAFGYFDPRPLIG
jgi:limonene-1,2-epoxide hydrolase